MKLTKSFFMGLMVAALGFTSCSDDKKNDNNNNDGNVVVLEGNLDTRTLTKDKKYLVRGQVFVRDGKTLTIQPGTLILGEKRTKGTLIVDRGGKMIAEGTANEPIVMTSNQGQGERDRGDWGGLVILGKAKTNRVNPEIEGITPAVVFGGDNDADNSGIYKYLRVEFAGIEISPNNETNSITMGGVGSNTIMEYCQVSWGGDDGFEWFGGTVNGKYLVSFGTWDDCFDVDFGYSGKVQFGISVRYPSYADQSGSNAFETDNGPDDSDVTPYTTGTFSNITAIGPIYQRTLNSSGAYVNSAHNSNYQYAIDMRRRTALTIANSVFIGYPRGIRMNQPSVVGNYEAGRGKLLNNILVAPTSTYQAGTDVTTTQVSGLWLTTGWNNTTITENEIQNQFAVLGINSNIAYGARTREQYPSNPAFTVTSGLLASGASFADPKLSTGFQNVAFRGGFGATDWTDGWAEFDPIDKVY